MRSVALCALSAAVLSALPSFASADVLGIADNYNAFIFQNMTQSSDILGAVAVGGDLTLTSDSVAQSLGTTGAHVVVGGSFTQSGGSIYGDIYAGKNVTLSGGLAPVGNIYVGGNYSSDNEPTGTVYHVGTFMPAPWATNPDVTVSSVTLPVNFSQTETALTNTSAELAALAPTESYTDVSNALTLTGTDGENIFSVSATDLKNATSIAVDLPSDGFAIINVTGSSSVLLPNVGLTLNASQVLWNLNGVTSISMGSFQGSVLAPTAAITATSGDYHGNLIAYSFNGPDELHIANFDYDVPNLTPVFSPASAPSPASATSGLLLLGGLGIAVYRKRRQNHS